MKVNLISLRAEFATSGERQSSLVLKHQLAAHGFDVDEFENVTSGAQRPSLRNLADLTQLRVLARRLQDPGYAWHLVKLPTAAQLPWLDRVARRHQDRLVVVLDSVCAGRPNAGSLWRELRHEPVLAIGKRIANHRLWARLSRIRPRAILCCAETQRAEAAAVLGAERSRYWVIPNASPADAVPTPWQAPGQAAFIVGYLGHPFAHKGCLDLIESARWLPAGRPCAFHAAFSNSGRASVRQAWLRAGGTDQRIVSVADFLRGLDLLCLPLYTEFGTKVFPNVLLEAMRVGVPILTTRSAVSDELLGAVPGLRWLDEVSPRAIARAITDLQQADLGRLSRELRLRHIHYDTATQQRRWADFARFLTSS